MARPHRHPVPARQARSHHRVPVRPTRHEIKPAAVEGAELVRRELVVHHTATEVTEDDAAHIQDGVRRARRRRTSAHRPDLRRRPRGRSIGRTCLVLTQRTDHIDAIVAGLDRSATTRSCSAGRPRQASRARRSADAIADSGSRRRHRPRRHRLLPRRGLRLARARHAVPRVPARVQGTGRPVRRTTAPHPRRQAPRRAPRLRRRPHPGPRPRPVAAGPALSLAELGRRGGPAPPPVIRVPPRIVPHRCMAFDQGSCG